MRACRRSDYRAVACAWPVGSNLRAQAGERPYETGQVGIDYRRDGDCLRGNRTSEMSCEPAAKGRLPKSGTGPSGEEIPRSNQL